MWQESPTTLTSKFADMKPATAKKHRKTQKSERPKPKMHVDNKLNSL
jgi:hypothetical protein